MATVTENAREKLQAFFESYQDRMNRSLADTADINAEAFASAFASCFVEASPVGINCGKNDDSFLENIPKGIAFYRSIGTKSMTIAGLDTTALDEFHYMTRVHWQAVYIKENRPDKMIAFTLIYFTQHLEDEPKIFAYITGDEQKVLHEEGLIPG